MAGLIVYIWMLGDTLAMIISWSSNHSIPWAVFHGFLSWWYVGYYAIFK